MEGLYVNPAAPILPTGLLSPAVPGAAAIWLNLPYLQWFEPALLRDLLRTSNLAYHNGATQSKLSPPGWPWGSSTFDGTNDYMDVTKTIGTGSYTFGAWFRPTTIDSANHYVMGVQNGGSDGGRFLRISSSNVLQFEVIGDSVVDANGTTTLVSGTWYFGVGVFDRANAVVKVFLNGKQEASTSISGVTYSATLSAFVLGGRPDFPDTNCLAGQIGPAFILPYPLSQGAISALYHDFLEGLQRTLNFLPVMRSAQGAAADTLFAQICI